MYEYDPEEKVGTVVYVFGYVNLNPSCCFYTADVFFTAVPKYFFLKH